MYHLSIMYVCVYLPSIYVCAIYHLPIYHGSFYVSPTQDASIPHLSNKHHLSLPPCSRLPICPLNRQPWTFFSTWRKTALWSLSRRARTRGGRGAGAKTRPRAAGKRCHIPRKETDRAGLSSNSAVCADDGPRLPTLRIQ